MWRGRGTRSGRLNRLAGVTPSIPQAVAALLLVAAMVLGGREQGPGDAVVHAIALVAFGLAALRWHATSPRLPARALLWTCALALGWGAVQLVPLPVDTFARLSLRAEVVAQLHVAGLVPQWLPLTLDRWGTVRALLALGAFLAMWMLCMTLSRRERMQLLKLALAVAVPMVLLGFAQASLKRDTTGANALFANRNHLATLLAMLLPFAFACAFEARRRIVATAWRAVAVLLLLGAALTFSRLGSVLALSAAALAMMLVSSGGNTRSMAGRSSAWRASLATGLVAMLAIAWFASDRLLARFGSDPFGDLRWTYFRNSWHVLQSYLPWGSGLGTFADVYARAEPLATLGQYTYALHAHNEVLEVGIEAGLPGLLLLAAFACIVVAGAFRAFRHTPKSDHWRKAAAISACVPLLHSLLDYPLRTLACGAVLALVLSLLLERPATRGDANTPSLIG